MQQGVNVVKASAGSGKTHRLTHDYINLLLSGDENGYKHILAVTFTNKATDEMKSRVIRGLYEISEEGTERSKEAGRRLRRLLHDYSCFSVSTIDKFFQTVMRSFAREIGQYASYRVELDTGAVLDQVVDLLLDSIEDREHENLRKWLRDYSFDLVERGDGWDISRPLKEMAEQFLDESFLIKAREAGQGRELMGDKASLKAFLNHLEGIVKSFEDEAAAIGKDGLKLLSDNNVAPDSLYHKARGAAMIFKKWASQNIETKCPTDGYIDGAIRDFKQDPSALEAIFNRVKTHLGTPLKLCNTARLVRNNIYLLGIYNDLQRILDEYLKENNVVLLQLSTDMLSRIIAEDDAPFIYEKIGSRYEHLMLDEAQDTSLMQWNNFRPLFRNSQSSGAYSLVVGDIKQSIYRWRGSDWRLMSDYLSRDLSDGLMSWHQLDENWRSGAAIVNFNNSVFLNVAGTLAQDPDRCRIAEKVKEIYSDCRQSLPDRRKHDPEGYVRLEFISKDECDSGSWRDEALRRMIADLGELLAEGYDYKDITVLVRTNREGAFVAAALMDSGVSVLTEDSLLIGSSPCISKLMSLLSWLVNPDDPVSGLQVREFKDSLPENKATSLYETCEQMLGSGMLSHKEEDLPFINAFLDAVLAFQEKYGSSLRAFVKWWEDTGRKKSICAPDGQNAVRVMTVHKAKGLSLDAVIIPFCKEEFRPSNLHQNVIWCHCPEQLGASLLIPLKSSSKLQSSLFEKEYEEERCLKHIDVVNIWYVAFTRSKSRLFVYAPLPFRPKDGFKPSSMENVLYMQFENKLVNGRFESGRRQAFVRKTDASALVDDPQPAFCTASMGEGRLRLSLRGDNYFAQDKSARREGVERHEEMARVVVSAEYEALSGGRHWFDGSYDVMNEASIVDAVGEIQRPDRVLISKDGSKVVVIDYKFGQPHSGHNAQVRRYVSLMREMGYPETEGWLWYISTGEIVRV